ncbi:MAG: hypothetical protein IMW89_21145 [Ktedonobacteraceae bacterium]|nr:hypothetical protein [Ktedonobacteraceae bacterium]
MTIFLPDGAGGRRVSYTDVAQQKTQPLSAAEEFHAYLLRYRLNWMQVARAAGVPGLVVWSIDHGLMVSPAHARRVRQGLITLTGVPYTGPILSFESWQFSAQRK